MALAENKKVIKGIKLVQLSRPILKANAKELVSLTE